MRTWVAALIFAGLGILVLAWAIVNDLRKKWF